MSEMKQYVIPLSWEMYGKVRVEAESLEEAVEYALGPECPLPDGDYIEAYIQVEYEYMNEMEGKKDA